MGLTAAAGGQRVLPRQVWWLPVLTAAIHANPSTYQSPDGALVAQTMIRPLRIGIPRAQGSVRHLARLRVAPGLRLSLLTLRLRKDLSVSVPGT